MLSIHFRQDTVITQFKNHNNNVPFYVLFLQKQYRTICTREKYITFKEITRPSVGPDQDIAANTELGLPCTYYVGLTLTSERRTSLESKTGPVVSDRRLT